MADVIQDCDPTKLPKRKVALTIGYVGTSYRGMQLNRKVSGRTDVLPAVEDTLEWAIMKAGLMRKSNFGALGKVKWSRSSRTDKGVHSIATVVALKINCEPDRWQTDPEGLEYADAINRHLPPDIRVFSVQRVPEGFAARHACSDRTYAYYVPAAVLGLRFDGSGHDAGVLERLRDTLRAFVGNHPFHNFTKRRAYVPARFAEQEGKQGRPRPQAFDEDDEDTESEDDMMRAGVTEASSTSSSQEHHTPGKDGNTGGETNGALHGRADSQHDAGERDNGAAAGEDARPRWIPRLDAWWEDTPASKLDTVYAVHWRTVYSFEVEEVCEGDGGRGGYVKLLVHGNSFMFNQIRRMVGATIAVARGVLPLELVQASLATPCTCTLPLAPPITLLLAGNTFYKFRMQPSQPTCIAQVNMTGERLTLRESGTLRRDAFVGQVLEPHIQGLLDNEAWRLWTETLDKFVAPQEEIDAVLLSYRAWLQMLEERRAARALERAEQQAVEV